MLNNDAIGARNYLADEGKDRRIVSEVWIVIEAELSEHFATSGSISASINADGKSLEVTAKGGKHGTQTITLSEGSTFTYSLYKVKEWNKDKTETKNMEDDYKGMS
jgi:hypothetical protein